jgi:hypothetical protein
MKVSPKAPSKKVANAPKSTPVPAAAKVAPPKKAPVSVAGAVKKSSAKPQTALPTTLKVVRDGYSMPKNEYDALKLLKAQCLKHGASVKKSELLRTGLRAMVALSPAALIAAVQALPEVKTGRKKKAV